MRVPTIFSNCTLIASALICWFNLEVFALELVVKKSGAQILAEKSKNADVLATLEKGDVLESISRQGMLWEVKLEGGVRGYIPVFHVSRRPSQSGNLSDAIRKASSENRQADDIKGNRSRTAVMGVRGLREDDETAFIGNVKPDFDLVYRMEDSSVDMKRVQDLEKRIMMEVSSRMKSNNK